MPVNLKPAEGLLPVPGVRLGVAQAGVKRAGRDDLLVVEDENPEDQDIVYYVGPNVLGLEKRFAFPPRESKAPRIKSSCPPVPL